MSKKRVDQLVGEFHPQLSRSKIQSLISRGKIKISIQGDLQVFEKPGAKLESDSITKEDILILPDEELQYVSRGALKLKKALDEFEISCKDKMAMDVGLSTGGFSDLMLQRGARKILGIDVGQNQLHSSLKEEPRLLAFDKINARNPMDQEILREFFGEREPKFDLVVVDVSFISLKLVLPNLLNYIQPDGQLVALVKPQFELQKADLNKKGVVKDPGKSKSALQKIIELLQENGIKQVKHCDSPIEGDDGNQEFLIAAFCGS